MKTSIKLMNSLKLSQVKIPSTFAKAMSRDPSITPDDIAANADILHTPRIIGSGSYSLCLPEKRKLYEYMTSSANALHDLGLASDQPEDPIFQRIVSGQMYLNKSFVDQGYPIPYAQAYAGWQFRQFAGQLGDGRVVNLFEVPKNKPDSFNRPFYELQLKGAGKTPFSRFADGKAVLRSSIREYIISEHLHAIGIPSSRALSLTYLPDTLAQRHRAETCAIVARFAELWVRLGNFNLYRWRGDRKGIRELTRYVIDELFTIENEKFGHFNAILQQNSSFFQNTEELIGELTEYDQMYYETIVRNAATAAKWQCYGFLNGVLNTDNTSVLGLSMDFGPFSIMDRYNPNYTPNSEDHELRYSYKNSPTAIWWNLTRFGEDLAELIGAGSKIAKDDTFLEGNLKEEWEEPIIKRATKVIEIGGEIYQYAFTKTYVETFFNRLGLPTSLIDYSNIDEHNQKLITPLFDLLLKVQCDYNKFFLILQQANFENFNPKLIGEAILEPSFDENDSIYTRDELLGEIATWLNMYHNYLTMLAIDNPTWKRSISEKYNPIFLPRNWILDQVIEFTQESAGKDLSYLKKLEKMSLNPYDSSKWGDELKDLEKTWLLQSDKGRAYSMLQCSCSS